MAPYTKKTGPLGRVLTDSAPRVRHQVVIICSDPPPARAFCPIPPRRGPASGCHGFKNPPPLRVLSDSAPPGGGVVVRFAEPAPPRVLTDSAPRAAQSKGSVDRRSGPSPRVLTDSARGRGRSDLLVARAGGSFCKAPHRVAPLCRDAKIPGATKREKISGQATSWRRSPDGEPLPSRPCCSARSPPAKAGSPVSSINCASSVEPVMAVTEERPPAMTCVTSSK